MRTFVVVWTLAGILLIGISFALYSCRPQPGRWEGLTEWTNSVGDCFIVEQEHYDWVEGWGVNITYISSGKIYGSSLQIETGPWSDVRISEQGDLVTVRRGTNLVGVYSYANRRFTNCIYNFSESWVDGADGVQGKPISSNTPQRFRKSSAFKQNPTDKGVTH
jgi:hypothetical protein